MKTQDLPVNAAAVNLRIN